MIYDGFVTLERCVWMSGTIRMTMILIEGKVMAEMIMVLIYKDEDGEGYSSEKS